MIRLTNTNNNTQLSVVTMVLAILSVVTMRFIIGFDGLYGQDSYEYLRYAKALKTWMITGTDPGDYFWPVWYPLTGAAISFIVQDVAFSLQLISCLSLAIVFIFSNRIIRLLFPGTSYLSPILFNLLLIGLSPYLLRFGFSVMADMLTLALLIISVYYFLKAGKKPTTISLMMGGLFGTMACMTRYAAFVPLFPVAVYAYWMFFQKSAKTFNAIPAFIIGILPIVPHILIRGSQSTHFIQHDWITLWNPVNFFKNEFHTRDGGTHYSLPNIIYSFGGLFHPRYCFVAILIVLLRFKKLVLNTEMITIGTGLILYLVFLAGIPYQNNRFLLIIFPFFVYLLFNPWQSLMQELNKKTYIILVFLILMVQVILFPFGFWPVYSRNKLEKQVFTYLATKQNPDIYTMDIDVSLAGRGYQGHIHNIYNNYYGQPDTNALVIFNAHTMPFQWNQMNPMNNWQHFNHDYQLKEIKRFKNGWAVYEFE